MPVLLCLKKTDAPVPDSGTKWLSGDVVDVFPVDTVFSDKTLAGFDIVRREDIDLAEARDLYLRPVLDGPERVNQEDPTPNILGRRVLFLQRNSVGLGRRGTARRRTGAEGLTVERHG